MRLRLHGTSAETAAMLTALAKVLDIQQISRPYPDKAGLFQRIYIDAVPAGNGIEKKEARP